MRAETPQNFAATPATFRPSRYHGRKAVLATRHGKEHAIAPVFASMLGITLHVSSDLDTDSLGTFSGEVPRRGGMPETALAKARMGAEASGLSLAIASEGSFGPHPAFPFIPAGRELMLFVDIAQGLVISEEQLSEATNYASLDVQPGADVEGFLSRVGFPAHAVILRSPAGISKGIRSLAEIRRLISSAEGPLLLETDMRAHMNPTRMQEIAKLASRLVQRIATPCPLCASPGFGQVRAETGLACADCGAPTALVAHVVHGCVLCGHKEHYPRPDGRTAANPAECPECNP